MTNERASTEKLDRRFDDALLLFEVRRVSGAAMRAIRAPVQRERTTAINY